MTGPAAARGFALEVLPPEAWAVTVAGRLAARLRERPASWLCLPTGDTPAPLYRELVALERRGGVSLAAATVILLDEWVGLPAGDPARCDVRLRDQLLEPLAAPPAFISIDVDGRDPDAAAAAHDVVARGIDLALVGLGPNGHVGFNEPGSRPDDASRLVRLAASTRKSASARYGARQMPTAGITVGLARLLEAGECWLLVTGEHKAAVLRRALDEPEGPDCPASWLRRHLRLAVLADEPAASLVRGR